MSSDATEPASKRQKKEEYVLYYVSLIVIAIGEY